MEGHGMFVEVLVEERISDNLFHVKLKGNKAI